MAGLTPAILKLRMASTASPAMADTVKSSVSVALLPPKSEPNDRIPQPSTTAASTDTAADPTASAARM